MKRFAAFLLAVLLPALAIAAQPRATSIEFKQGAGCPNGTPCITRSLPVPPSYARNVPVSELPPVNGVRRLALGQNGKQWVQFNEADGPVWSRWVYPITQCDPSLIPADAQQDVPCTNGVNATWHQSHGWTQGPPPLCTIAAQPWQPTAPGANDCRDVTPPPGGDLRIDFSFVDHGSEQYADFISYANRTDEPDAQTLVWAYKITGTASYCTRAVSQVDAYMRNPGQIAGDSYLQVDQFLAPMAMAAEWCPTVTSAQRSLWFSNAFAVLDTLWGQGCNGWGVCDLFNNYHDHFVRATVYVAIASGDATRIAFAMQKWNEQLAALAAKLPDGGSLEGMGYFYAVMWLNDTAMVIHDSGYGDAYNANAYLSDSSLVWVHGTTPDLAHFAPISSQTQGSDAPLNDYRRNFVGSGRHQSNSAAARAQYDYWLEHIFHDVYRANTWSNLWTWTPTQTQPPLVYKAERVGIFGRTGWNAGATYVVTVAGDRTQSHAHAEQGEVMWWKNGWGTVPGHVFSHSGINGEAPGYSGRAKNVVGFYRNGAEQVQQPGVPILSNYTENQLTGDYTVCLDMTALYLPAAGVNLWKRCNEVAGGVATVTDYVQVAAGTTATQQWITAARPTCSGQTCASDNVKFTVLSPANPQFVFQALPALDSDFMSGNRTGVPCNTGCATTVGPNP